MCKKSKYLKLKFKNLPYNYKTQFRCFYKGSIYKYICMNMFASMLCMYTKTSCCSVSYSPAFLFSFSFAAVKQYVLQLYLNAKTRFFFIFCFLLLFPFPSIWLSFYCTCLCFMYKFCYCVCCIVVYFSTENYTSKFKLLLLFMVPAYVSNCMCILFST